MVDDRIKVLIVDDNEDTRYVIQRLLEYENDIEIIDFATNGEEAIEKVHSLSPDVVLMDINMKGLNGIDATQQLRDTAPRTKVVIVSVQDDPNYMRSAMRAGAVDFLAKPPRPDDLIQAIRRAYGMIPDEVASPPPPGPGKTGTGNLKPGTGGLGDFDDPGGGKNGKVISVMGLKGGVGKTTIAVSLATGLVNETRNKDVLLIDTNTYTGDLHIVLNTRGEYDVVTTSFMAAEGDLEYQGLDNILVKHDSGISLLVAPRNPLDANPLPGEGFKDLLDYLRDRFDYIVLDTGTTIDAGFLSVARNSDYICVVTQSIMPALKDTQVLLNLFREVGVGGMNDLEEPAGEIILVLNNYNEATSRIKAEQIKNFLKQEVEIEIAADANADASLNNYRPLIDNDPRQFNAVNGLRQLVTLVRGRVEGIATEKPVQQEKDDQGNKRRWSLFGG